MELIKIVEIKYTKELNDGPAVRVKFICDGKAYTALQSDVEGALSRDELTTNVINSILKCGGNNTQK